MSTSPSPSLAPLDIVEEYFDLQLKRWAFSVQRAGLTQHVSLEQPASWCLNPEVTAKS